MNETTRNILIGVAAVVVLFFAYKFLVVGEKKVSEPPLVATPATPPAVEADASRSGNLSDLLLRIGNIKVDTQIFSSSAFKSLRDFRVPISPEPVGKADPFSS